MANKRVVPAAAVNDGTLGRMTVRVFDAKSGVPVRNATVDVYWIETDHFPFDMHPGALMEEKRLTESIFHWRATEETGEKGEVEFFNLQRGRYAVVYGNVTPFDMQPGTTRVLAADLTGNADPTLAFALPIDPVFEIRFQQPGRVADDGDAVVGNTAIVRHGSPWKLFDVGTVSVVPAGDWRVHGATSDMAYSRQLRAPGRQDFLADVVFAVRGIRPGAESHRKSGPGPAGAALAVGLEFESVERPTQPISGNIGVSLSRTETEATPDLALWTLIRNSTEALSFNHYRDFLDELFCGRTVDTVDRDSEPFKSTRAAFNDLKRRRALPFTDSDAYRVLKAATEAFVMVNCGVFSSPFAFDNQRDNAYLDRRDIPAVGSLKEILERDYLETIEGAPMLPYLAVIRGKLPDVRLIAHNQEHNADICFGIIQERLANPCLIELIWNYWQEEGMLVQTMNVITQRFQNLRSPLASDPLANTEIDMLRPLNNLLWGYTQDEQHRLTVVRRNYEYDHHYGVRLDGKAVRNMRPADSRSKFLEAFHHLLRLLTAFYRQDDDTTVKADAFPILNALKEVHLILSQGAHNQYGDLPSTARIEMLMQQWLLARPEFREFLPTRVMVAYPEPWMDRVDAMKKLQMWSDTSVMHFRNLAIFGEQLLLSIRFGHWSDVYEATQAFNWARFWRPQAQGYIHAYRAATGVDLSVDATNPAEEATLPSVLLRQRLARQQQRSAM
ncbi:hypothetical protein [Pseudoduganella umbonata]|uniref:8-amino-7-oxononanoate synthase n=1 Tax=Pseudoduganella umbonata TaxID=864828 RepID=A0A4P8HKD5_9BURK|nr:hypothetical protein [Pseudoduganella umbonata]MBB3220041.1 hypothetical protein [Pseudoduganella umbonata]QCP10047.1 hypothetical protein FCL38_06120 [Pseudoduganella umbonata]